MTRTKAFFLFLLVILLGLVAGWFLQQWLQGPPQVSPVDVNTPVSIPQKPKSKAGFCCITAGSACTEVENPGICFRSGGLAFNVSQVNCDYFCSKVKP